MKHPEVKYLYKYRSMEERHLSMLKKGNLYLSTYNNFNDPFDCYLNPELLEIDVHNLKSIPPFDKFFSSFSDEQIISMYKNALVSQPVVRKRENYRICCFSETEKNILMWSHYSDSHTGFCMQFHRDPNDYYFGGDYLHNS